MEVCGMKPNFDEMSLKELRSYVLAHRDDDDAFYAYRDRSNVECNWIEMPASDLIEDLDRYPDFLNTIRTQQGHKPR